MSKWKTAKIESNFVIHSSSNTKSTTGDWFHIFKSKPVSEDFKCFKKVKTSENVNGTLLDTIHSDTVFTANVETLKNISPEKSEAVLDKALLLAMIPS